MITIIPLQVTVKKTTLNGNLCKCTWFGIHPNGGGLHTFVSSLIKSDVVRCVWHGFVS